MTNDIELYMVVRRSGNKRGSYPGQVNKGTRFYQDLRGVNAFLNSHPETDVYLITGTMVQIPPEDFDD